jgi:hypothetical protein
MRAFRRGRYGYALNPHPAACARVGPGPPHLSGVWGSQLESWGSRPRRCAAPGCQVYTNDLVRGAAAFCQGTALMTSLDKPGRSTKVPQAVTPARASHGLLPGRRRTPLQWSRRIDHLGFGQPLTPAARTTTICCASASRPIPTARPTTPADVSPPLAGRR